MDDLTQKLQALLADPESMKNLSELAAMRQADAPPEDAAAPVPDESTGTGTPQTESEAPPFDFAKLLAVGQALSAVQQDETADLLRALKPYLSPERAKRADKAARMLRLYAAAGILRENGMLNDLFGGDS